MSLIKQFKALKSAIAYRSAEKLNSKLLTIEGTTISINSKAIQSLTQPVTLKVRLVVDASDSEITFSENDQLIRKYSLEHTGFNFELKGKYIFSDFYLHPGMLSLSGVISDSANQKPPFGEDQTTTILFQPLYLPHDSWKNHWVSDLDLWQKGFEVAGTLSRENLRYACICHGCQGSFFLKGYHLGYMESVFLRADDRIQNLVIDLSTIKTLQEGDSETIDWRRLESQLPVCPDTGGRFKHNNPLRCPHCGSPYIDLLKYPVKELDDINLEKAAQIKAYDFNCSEHPKEIFSTIAQFGHATCKSLYLTRENKIIEAPYDYM